MRIYSNGTSNGSRRNSMKSDPTSIWRVSVQARKGDLPVWVMDCRSLSGKKGCRVYRVCPSCSTARPVGATRLALSRLSWKWKGRSTVKIAERAREETTKALQRRREGRHFEAALAGTGAGFQAL